VIYLGGVVFMCYACYKEVVGNSISGDDKVSTEYQYVNTDVAAGADGPS